jgi:hypothetical protein
VQRAREAAGHPFRPSFAQATSISIRSLVKLEAGEPVGPRVYEAVADHLPRWTRDTPREILDGSAAPEPTPATVDNSEASAARRRILALTDIQLAERIVEISEVQGIEAAGEYLAKVREIRQEADRETRQRS